MSKIWNSVVKGVTGKGNKDVDALDNSEVKESITEFNEMFNEKHDEKGMSSTKIQERKKNYATMVNHYYNLATDFYEYGWGQSFHFANRYPGEAFHQSLARHEHYLALRLGLKPGMQCLDLGCGVGGPMREIARFSGAKVVGVNNNDYQVKRCGILNEKYSLSDICNAVKGDFMNLPFKEGQFDAAYAIEATCHAPDKVKCFSQIFKALKPGGVFAGYEWVMTDKYDPRNEQHRVVKHQIEHGDGLPDLPYADAVVEGLEKSGFIIEEHFDMAEYQRARNPIGWHETLQGGYSFNQFKHTKLGRLFTHYMVTVLETARIAPKGTTATHKMLTTAADALAKGGDWKIFTPMYFFIARKPSNK